MDKFLRTIRLDADPNSTNDSVTWKHWIYCFDRFVTKVGASESEQFDLLCNFVSQSLYQYISTCSKYSKAKSNLENLFVKAPNELLARHWLATCKQKVDQSLDQFVHKLRVMARDCQFRAVSADKNEEDAIRDAFVSGMRSGVIRQRLLEKRYLDLKMALDTAKTLDMALKESSSFSAPSQLVESSLSSSAISTEEMVDSETIAT
uniref:Retrotransposon gag domain-containing protein n=1 Tax=Biomphalaria glabrata TaxID=6526 RepID=A0A2C9LK41_BIOGL